MSHHHLNDDPKGGLSTNRAGASPSSHSRELTFDELLKVLGLGSRKEPGEMGITGSCEIGFPDGRQELKASKLGGQVRQSNQDRRNDMICIGSYIARLRQTIGMSRPLAAEFVGLPYQQYVGWEEHCAAPDHLERVRIKCLMEDLAEAMQRRRLPEGFEHASGRRATIAAYNRILADFRAANRLL